MLKPLKQVLDRLRTSFSGRADQAYEDRDAAKGSAEKAAYAEGEGHAYGIASDEVRDAQDENE